MNNIFSTSTSETSPDTDSQPLDHQSLQPLASEPASIVETINSISSEPVSTSIDLVEQVNIDGNVQAHIDVKYEAHDVALTSAKSVNDHQQNNGFKACEHHKIDLTDSDQHSEKSKPSCVMLNKLKCFLAFIVFILLFCSIICIIFYLKTYDRKNNQSKLNYVYRLDDGSISSEILSNEPYFYLKHPAKDGIIVVLSRRGALVNDILIPYKDETDLKQNRSIVVKADNENYFGSVITSSNDPNNTMNITNQLPSNHPFLNMYKEDWSMYAYADNPMRVRFVYNAAQIIYELSSNNPNEFTMKTIVSPPLNQQIVADLTNNIYFNLRGYGNLSAHYLNLSSSKPIEFFSGKTVELDQLNKPQQVDKLVNMNKYFYTFERVGIGKNYMAMLFNNETGITMRVFSDHTGVIIDPYGIKSPNLNENRTTSMLDMRGIRISPRQSPFYHPVIHYGYGPTLVVHPSEAIHTTWWQFDYKN
ncbi:unnamed protein product [Rotaria socialis]|uniref:Uncharacterized protein n=1 Tax=Rotaria socialis TaxID=392032 RepID=A0A818FPC4_9BILA|nr:unnamed protein product [Rotaria socialis]